MRVIHFIDSLRLGGKERQLVELLKGLRNSGSCLSLLLCMGTETFYLDDVMAIGVPIKYLIRKVRWDPNIYLKLFNIVRDFRPDIIHTNEMMTTFYALPICKILGIKLINGSIRNAFSEGGIRWRLERCLLKFSDYRIANSEAGLASRGFDVSSPHSYVVHNGFDLRRIHTIQDQRSMRGALGIGDESVVGMVAEFSDQKDYGTFIQAAQLVLDTRKDTVFLAVGNGKNYERHKTSVRNEHKGKLIFLGARKDVEQIVNVFTIGVLATYTEGISNSIMEYMTLSKPVIATDGGGTREILLNEETGLLVPPGDPYTLAAKINLLLDDPYRADQMGRSGFRRLTEHFSLSMMTERILHIYQTAMSDRK